MERERRVMSALTGNVGLMSMTSYAHRPSPADLVPIPVPRIVTAARQDGPQLLGRSADHHFREAITVELARPRPGEGTIRRIFPSSRREHHPFRRPQQIEKESQADRP